jgi:hypothetical protein
MASRYCLRLQRNESYHNFNLILIIFLLGHLGHSAGTLLQTPSTSHRDGLRGFLPLLGTGTAASGYHTVRGL